MKKLPKIYVAQMKVIPMDIEGNLRTMKAYIQEAKQHHADVIVFPELCVSGYLLGDRFEYEDFLHELTLANEMLKEESEGIVIIWGNIVIDKTTIGEDGRSRKYNAALIAQNGKWVSNGVLDGFMPKNNLPKYRIFDDARHFYPAYKLASERKKSHEEFFKAFPVIIGGKEYKLALTICEDLWEDEYTLKLSKYYKSQQVDLVCDLSASPWTLGKWNAREGMLTRRVKDIGAPILYVNCVGLQNNGKNLVWFDGASVFVNEEGKFIWRAKRNLEGVYEVAEDSVTFVRDSEIEELYSSLTSAMKEFFKDFKKVVIGLSGGIDSALMLALVASVIPQEKILTVNMPTRFNSKTTRSLAKQCAANFGIEYRIVSIDELYELQVTTLESSGCESLTTLTKENIQARLRGQQLASIAAHYQGVFTNNGNKTETALNYFTLYGDGGGVASFFGDLWKGQIYQLARFVNEYAGKEMIPEGVISIVPSAELSLNQNVDEGKGDPIYYEYHDKLLRAFTEYRKGITDIARMYVDGTLESYLGCYAGTLAKYFATPTLFIENLEWAWNAYNTEYKRVQLPPVFITSRRAFGFDRRDTIALAHYTQDYEVYKKRILDNSVLTT